MEFGGGIEHCSNIGTKPLQRQSGFKSNEM